MIIKIGKMKEPQGTGDATRFSADPNGRAPSIDWGEVATVLRDLGWPGA